MLTESQIKDRKNYLGGTDIAKILGLSRWGTALQVFAEKTGQIEPEDISGKMPVRLGIKFEPIISELFEEETGKKLHRVNEELRHPKYDFLRGHLDRRVVGEKAIVEIKSTSAWNKDSWADGEAPMDYQIQTMYYMALTGAERGYLVCLIGNQDLKIKTIERDQKVLDSIIEKAVDFWQRFVLTRTMPGIITARDTDTLLALFPNADPDDTVELDDNADAMIDSLQSLKQDSIALEKQIEQSQNEVKALLKDRIAGKSKRHIVRWANVDTVRIDSKKIAEKYPKIAEECAMKNSTRKFTVKTIKAQKGLDEN